MAKVWARNARSTVRYNFCKAYFSPYTMLAASARVYSILASNSKAVHVGPQFVFRRAEDLYQVSRYHFTSERERQLFAAFLFQKEKEKHRRAQQEIFTLGDVVAARERPGNRRKSNSKAYIVYKGKARVETDLQLGSVMWRPV